MFENRIESGISDEAYYEERKKKKKRRRIVFLIGIIGLVILIAAVIITITVLIPAWFDVTMENRVCSPRPMR